MSLPECQYLFIEEARIYLHACSLLRLKNDIWGEAPSWYQKLNILHDSTADPVPHYKARKQGSEIRWEMTHQAGFGKHEKKYLLDAYFTSPTGGIPGHHLSMPFQRVLNQHIQLWEYLQLLHLTVIWWKQQLVRILECQIELWVLCAKSNWSE